MTPMISIALLISLYTGTVGGDQPPSTPPSDERLAASVATYSLEGTVTELAQEETTGSSTTLTVGSDILFDFGSADLNAQAGKALSGQLDSIPDGVEVTVVGHTDAIGSDSSNQSLSERRAKAVAAAIRSARPDLSITAAGKGESDPVASNEQPEGRAKNRRVVLSWRS